MKKDEAIQLVGKRVHVWTSAQGQYCGSLEEVVSEKGRPWRGLVRIDGIMAVAQHFENGGVCRRGFRAGELIEVGGINIQATDAEGETDYAVLLKREIALGRERLEAMSKQTEVCSRHAWAVKGFTDGYEATLKCEENRTLTGEWDRKLLADEYLKIRERVS